jgi:DNA primase
MKYTPEQIQVAKSYPIVALLQANGLEPKRHTPKGVWYCSPFRTERTASFLVDRQNTFYDFGAGIGGDVIRLVCELYKIGFARAVQMLLEKQDFFFVSPNTNTENTPRTEKILPKIDSIKPLQSKFFKTYIESRKISLEIAKQYLQEVYYKVSPAQTKCYFGIGMKNVLEGYEIKNIQANKYYCLGPKAPTMIDKGQPKFWSVFEGMFDFLACLTYYQKPIASNVMILHSASIARKGLELLKEASKVYLFLDNDPAGNEATGIFTTHFGKACKDCRNIYSPHKDFNDFLTNCTNRTL